MVHTLSVSICSLQHFRAAAQSRGTPFLTDFYCKRLKEWWESVDVHGFHVEYNSALWFHIFSDVIRNEDQIHLLTVLLGRALFF